VVRGWIDDRLVHVQDAVVPGGRMPSITIDVVEPFAERRRLFARALSGGKPIAGVTVSARDASGVHGVQEAVTGRGGRITLLYELGRASPVLWLSMVANGTTLASPGPLEWADPALETDVELAEADPMEVTGRVTERGTGTGVDGRPRSPIPRPASAVTSRRFASGSGYGSLKRRAWGGSGWRQPRSLHAILAFTMTVGVPFRVSLTAIY
jgi:hypothetical protein